MVAIRMHCDLAHGAVMAAHEERQRLLERLHRDALVVGPPDAAVLAQYHHGFLPTGDLLHIDPTERQVQHLSEHVGEHL